MKKIIIGIPKAFLYYRYHILWTEFFKELGCEVLLSDDTTKKTIEQGKFYSIDESCLSSKIYLGHVVNLKDRCDYLFIPRVVDYGKGEKVCVKFNATYDIVKNLFPEDKILHYNMEKTKYKSEFFMYLKLGLKLNNNLIKVIKSYFYAKKKDKLEQKKRLKEQTQKLSSNNLKILLIAHPYNIYDHYVGIPIVKKLETMGIDLIYADILDRKTAKMYAKRLSPTLYWTYSKELIGSIGYYQYSVDGIIFLSSFPCGPDSLVNELMLRKITTLPMTNILIDELSASAGMETRLESFVDILKERRDLGE